MHEDASSAIPVNSAMDHKLPPNELVLSVDVPERIRKRDFVYPSLPHHRGSQSSTVRIKLPHEFPNLISGSVDVVGLKPALNVTLTCSQGVSASKV